MQNYSIFKALLQTRLLLAQQVIVDKMINLTIWATCSLFITGYIMQGFGLSSSFGMFQCAGVIATAGLFEIYPNVVSIVLDFEGPQSIYYYLTLPTNAITVISSMICGFATQGIMLSLWMVPLGKLLFFNQFNLAEVSWIKLIIIIVLSNLFFSSIVPALAGQLGNIDNIGNAWSRFIFPLWFLGGFQFSWASMYDVSKLFAYVMLANPTTYVMEGTRACILGQTGFIDWYICVGMIIFFSCITWTLSYYNMKKRLDFVG